MAREIVPCLREFPFRLHDPFGPLLFCYSVQALFIGFPPKHYFPFLLISELMAPGGPGVGVDANKPGSWNNFDLFYFCYFWTGLPVPLPAA